jgi:hypothetical protein
MKNQLDPNDIVHLNRFATAFCEMMEKDEPTGLILHDRNDGADLHISDRSGTIQTTISGDAYQTNDPVLEYCVALACLIKEHTTVVDSLLKSSSFDLSKTMHHVQIYEPELYNQLVGDSAYVSKVWLTHFERISSLVQDKTEGRMSSNWNGLMGPIAALKSNEWSFGKELELALQRNYIEDIRVCVELGEVTYVEFICHPPMPIFPSTHSVAQYLQFYLNIVNGTTNNPATLGILNKTHIFSLPRLMISDNLDLISDELANLLRMVTGGISRDGIGTRNTVGSGIVNPNTGYSVHPFFNPNKSDWDFTGDTIKPMAFSTGSYDSTLRGVGGMPMAFDEALVISDIIDEYNAEDGGVSSEVANIAELAIRIQSKPETFAHIARRLDGVVRPLMSAALNHGKQPSPTLVQLMRMYDVYRQYKQIF